MSSSPYRTFGIFPLVDHCLLCFSGAGVSSPWRSTGQGLMRDRRLPMQHVSPLQHVDVFLRERKSPIQVVTGVIRGVVTTKMNTTSDCLRNSSSRIAFRIYSRSFSHDWLLPQSSGGCKSEFYFFIYQSTCICLILKREISVVYIQVSKHSHDSLIDTYWSFRYEPKTLT